jgi:hypothetical protein
VLSIGERFQPDVALPLWGAYGTQMSDQLLSEAHRFLDWAREQGADLDGADESVWFVQGVLESMAEDTDESPSLLRSA